MRSAHRLLLASIGDDSHFVGMSLLALALREQGFLVTNLGIENTLRGVFSEAIQYDAVLISCNNGHVDLYLESFGAELARFRQHDDSPRLWYLGGNLSVNECDEAIVRKYRQMGFDFVAPKPIPWETVHNRLKKDLHNRSIPKHPVTESVLSRLLPETPDLHEVSDEPLQDEDFRKIRQEVLESWRSGAEVQSTDVRQNHRQALTNLPRLLEKARSRASRPLLQPRTGVAHTDDQIAILQYLRQHGLDICSVQLDAASRRTMYGAAEEGLRRTAKGDQSFLNGYPIPIHGVQGVREIVSATDAPFQVRAGSPDHRLTYEIALAGGASSVEGGFLCYLLPYDARTSPVTSLRYWKYVDKLAAWYTRQHGIFINREYFGPLTSTLIEPTVPICINIVEAILSAKSGVKCITVGLAEQGNRIQDVAAMRVLEGVTRRYLDSFGYPDVRLSTAYHHYMGAFTRDYQRARCLIENSSTTGGLSGATKILVKTPVESFKIPNQRENAEALQLTLSGVSKARDIEIDRAALERECHILKRQVASVMSVVERLGEGSVARGLIRTFVEGILEVPFSPNLYTPTRQVTVRDCDGAVRFMRPELLPFDDELAEFHYERVHRRMERERLSRPSELLTRDLTRVAEGIYDAWPLDGHYVG